ncbi:MAG: hypothetical protein AB7O78_03125 [Thermoleophilia bacterium]
MARLLVAEGAFVRRRVDLQRNWGDRFTITDIDLYVLRFTQPLLVRLSVGECKTTEAKSAPGIPDRLLWVAGVQRLVRADAAFVAVHRPVNARMRRMAEELECRIVDDRDLSRREALLGIGAEGPPFSHDARLVDLEHAARKDAKREPDLDRVYWFLRSEFWFLTPVSGLKRSLGAIRLLSRQWSPDLPNPRRQCVEWLTFHSIVACVVSLVRVAGEAYRTPEDTFTERFYEQLSEGKADYAAMAEISQLVDVYVTQILTEAGLRPGQVLDALGAFAPKPPTYAEPLGEVVLRLAGAPFAAGRLPQYVDELVARELLSVEEHAQDGIGDDVPSRLFRLVLAFLKGQIGLPDQLAAQLQPSGESKPTEAKPTPADSGRAGSVPVQAPEAEPQLFQEEGAFEDT